MKIFSNMPNGPKRTGMNINSPGLSRINGIDKALKCGFSDIDLCKFMNKLVRIEDHLTSLFGDHMRKALIEKVMFLNKNEGLFSPPSWIGIDHGKALLINIDEHKPKPFFGLIEKILFHEYGHALTLKADILWHSLSDPDKDNVQNNWTHGHCSLDLLNGIDTTKIFFLALINGMNNPYIDGLKTSEIYDFYSQLGRFHELHMYELRNICYGVIEYTHELITDRIANLIEISSAELSKQKREYMKEYIDRYREGDEFGNFPSLAFISVYADKTGNSDLMDKIKSLRMEESEKYFRPFAELYRLFSGLWDQIKLKV